jgi:2-polyprenyl-3-methyl-5-hydroxy-6-metoxy-1,4-benzoquinol methylase
VVAPLVRRAVAAYAGAERGVRFHVAVRARTCPFAELEAHLPPVGSVLDVGCGHGLGSLVFALGSPGRSVRGVDIDADKIPAAMAAAASAGADVAFEAVEPGWRPAGAHDAVVLVDVLYLLGAGAARGLLEDLARAVAPGGRILVKEIDVRPRWKYQLARIQEVVSTRLTRITEGEDVDFLPPAAIAEVLEASGLEVEHVALHRGRPHPHHLVLGRRVGP